MYYLAMLEISFVMIILAYALAGVVTLIIAFILMAADPKLGVPQPKTKPSTNQTTNKKP